MSVADLPEVRELVAKEIAMLRTLLDEAARRGMLPCTVVEKPDLLGKPAFAKWDRCTIEVMAGSNGYHCSYSPGEMMTAQFDGPLDLDRTVAWLSARVRTNG